MEWEKEDVDIEMNRMHRSDTKYVKMKNVSLSGRWQRNQVIQQYFKPS